MKQTVICIMGCIFNPSVDSTSSLRAGSGQVGEILLALRNDPLNLKFHNKWQLPGGGMEEGEKPLETLVREIKEETGLIVEATSKRPAIAAGVLSKKEHQGAIRLLIMAYPCKVIGGKLGEKTDDESSKLKWFKKADLPLTNMLPGNKEVIEELLISD